MEKRIIESQGIEVKLLDESTLNIRPLTLSERKECISDVPKQLMALENAKDEAFAESYIDVQVNLIHYIVSRSNKDFTKEEVETKMDSSIIEQVLLAVLRDPLSELFKW